MFTLSQNSQKENLEKARNEQEKLKYVESHKGMTYNDYCRKALIEYIFPEFLNEFIKGYITIKNLNHEYAETYILNKFLNKLSTDLVDGIIKPRDSMICYTTMKNILSSSLANSIEFAPLDNDNASSIVDTVIDTSERIIDNN